MRLIFSAKYRVGDKVQVLPGEHNFNWQGKIGKIVDVGIDLHAAAYIVEFADEIFKPCFFKEDLKLVKRKGNKLGRNRIIIDTKFGKGDKVPRSCQIKGVSVRSVDWRRRNLSAEHGQSFAAGANND